MIGVDAYKKPSFACVILPIPGPKYQRFRTTNISKVYLHDLIRNELTLVGGHPERASIPAIFQEQLSNLPQFLPSNNPLKFHELKKVVQFKKYGEYVVKWFWESNHDTIVIAYSRWDELVETWKRVGPDACKTYERRVCTAFLRSFLAQAYFAPAVMEPFYRNNNHERVPLKVFRDWEITEHNWRHSQKPLRDDDWEEIRVCPYWATDEHVRYLQGFAIWDLRFAMDKNKTPSLDHLLTPFEFPRYHSLSSSRVIAPKSDRRLLE